MEPEWKCIRIKRSRLHKDGCSLLTTGAQQTAQTLYTVQQLQKKFWIHDNYYQFLLFAWPILFQPSYYSRVRSVVVYWHMRMQHIPDLRVLNMCFLIYPVFILLFYCITFYHTIPYHLFSVFTHKRILLLLEVGPKMLINNKTISASSVSEITIVDKSFNYSLYKVISEW